MTLNKTAETISLQQDFKQQDTYNSTTSKQYSNTMTQQTIHQDTEAEYTYNDEDKWK